MSPMEPTPEEEEEEEEEDAGLAMRSSTSTPMIEGTKSSRMLPPEDDDAAETTTDDEAAAETDDDDEDADDADAGLAMRSSTSTPMTEGSNSSERTGEALEMRPENKMIAIKAQLRRRRQRIFKSEEIQENMRVFLKLFCFFFFE